MEHFNDIYYVQMEGVYYHGIYWIGSTEEEGKLQADRLASEDSDSYHKWVLYLYKFDDQCSIRYRTWKGREGVEV
jgi:hypothetical protein